jgi:hypothetical protein
MLSVSIMLLLMGNAQIANLKYRVYGIKTPPE